MSFNDSLLIYDKHPRYLGIWLDRKLSFKYHLATALATASQRLGFIRHTARYKWGLRTRQLLTLYGSYIRPVMEFAPMLWQLAAKSTLQGFHVIHHKALRTACGADTTSSGATVGIYCDMTPLKYRCDLLNLSWLDRMQRLPDDFPSTRLILRCQNDPGVSIGSNTTIPMATLARRRQLQRRLSAADDSKTDDSKTTVVRDGAPPSEDARGMNEQRALISLKLRQNRKQAILSVLRAIWVDEWVQSWPAQATDEENTPWDHLSRLSTGPPWGKLVRIGSRVQQNIMAALRLGHAPLALHRYRLGRVSSAACTCGDGHESVSHFLLSCARWNSQRERMISAIGQILSRVEQRQQRAIPVTESLLLGAHGLSVRDYKPVMRAVTAFVRHTVGMSWRYIYHR